MTNGLIEIEYKYKVKDIIDRRLFELAKTMLDHEEPMPYMFHENFTDYYFAPQTGSRQVSHFWRLRIPTWTDGGYELVPTLTIKSMVNKDDSGSNRHEGNLMVVPGATPELVRAIMSLTGQEYELVCTLDKKATIIHTPKVIFSLDLVNDSEQYLEIEAREASFPFPYRALEKAEQALQTLTGVTTEKRIKTLFFEMFTDYTLNRSA